MQTLYVLLPLLAVSSVSNMRICSDLFYSVAELIHLQDPVAKFQEVCKNYHSASLCVENQKDTCVQTTLFEIALSGLDELCNEREEDLMPHRECLDQHAELVLKNCDHSCQLTSVLTNLAGQGNAKRLQQLEEDHDALAKVCAHP
ncbi:hypothetical protein COOONC_22453 [Cooperia oncophora]